MTAVTQSAATRSASDAAIPCWRRCELLQCRSRVHCQWLRSADSEMVCAESFPCGPELGCLKSTHYCESLMAGPVIESTYSCVELPDACLEEPTCPCLTAESFADCNATPEGGYVVHETAPRLSLEDGPAQGRLARLPRSRQRDHWKLLGNLLQVRAKRSGDHTTSIPHSRVF